MAVCSNGLPGSFRGGSGEPVVLIHGFTATWRGWLPVIPALAAHHDVYAPTLTGHDGGPPAVTGRRQTIESATDDVEQALDEQGFGTVHVVGNSMGGTLAIELAKRGRARSLVALSPGGGWHPGDREEARVEAFFARQLRAAKAAEPWLPLVMGRPRSRRLALRDVMARGDRLPYAEAVAMARASTRTTIVEDVFGALRDGTGAVRDLDRVRCPALVAWAQCDRVLPLARHAQRFRDEIPDVEFRVLPGVGHVPMADDPALVAATIGDWVDRHAAGGDAEASRPDTLASAA